MATEQRRTEQLERSAAAAESAAQQIDAATARAQEAAAALAAAVERSRSDATVATPRWNNWQHALTLITTLLGVGLAVYTVIDSSSEWIRVATIGMLLLLVAILVIVPRVVITWSKERDESG